MTALLTRLNDAIDAELEAQGLPSPVKPVVANLLSDGWEALWLPPTFSPGEYARVRLLSSAGIWGIEEWTGQVGGEEVIVSHGELTGHSVFEPVAWCGKSSNSTRNWVAPRHGNIAATSLGAYLNSVGPGLTGLAQGASVRGHHFGLECYYNTYFPGTTDVFGTLVITYGFSRDGMNVQTVRAISDSSVVSNAAYGMNLPILSSFDQFETGGTTITLFPNTTVSNIDMPNLGPQTKFTFSSSARPNLKAIMSLPWETPGAKALGWADAVNGQAFVQRRPPSVNSSFKLYVLERTKPTESAWSAGGNNALYQLEKTP